MAEIRENKKAVVTALIKMHHSISEQFHILENYFDYYEDDINSEPIRVVRAIRKTINEKFESKIKTLRGE